MFQAFVALGGQASLRQIYEIVELHPRSRRNKNWRPKVRQTIQADQRYVRVGPGAWAFAERYSPKKVAKLQRLRRERYPVKPKRSRQREG